MRSMVQLLGLATCVFCLGYTVAVYTTLPPAMAKPVQLYTQTGTIVPTVYIQGIYNQQLRGSTHGNVRFVLGDTLPDIRPNTEFSIPAGVLLTHHVQVEAPEGMQYLASKNGSKYYSVYSTAAQRIAPKNRVYFTDAISAELQGYRP